MESYKSNQFYDGDNKQKIINKEDCPSLNKENRK